MAPRDLDPPTFEVDGLVPSDVGSEPNTIPAQKPFPFKVVWRNVVLMGSLHLVSVYALVFLVPWMKYQTWIFTALLHVISALGITAGAHRLWSHRAYKAGLPLRILLAVFNCFSLQNDIIEWARDHRVHHKFSETDADPHNAKRGFFFAHVGWLLVRKHPDVKEKGKTIDISDLYNDPVLVIQRKIYRPATLLCCFVIPTVLPWYYWGESMWTAYCVCGLLRYALSLNTTWCVNSVAHMWGNRPYDKRINPVENLLVSLGAIGEGFHNYHHTFPQDYSTSEFGILFNFTTGFLNFMALCGLVTNRKTIPAGVVQGRKQRTGDGSSRFRDLLPFR